MKEINKSNPGDEWRYFCLSAEFNAQLAIDPRAEVSQRRPAKQEQIWRQSLI